MLSVLWKAGLHKLHCATFTHFTSDPATVEIWRGVEGERFGGRCTAPETRFPNPAYFLHAQCLHFAIYGVLKMHVDFWVENTNIINENFFK
jgi:hypothetical protein